MRTEFLVALVLGSAAVGAVSSARAALVISDAATSNVNCASGICTATAADAVLNAKEMKKALQHGALTLVSGALAQDIVIDAKVTWVKQHHLTLDAFRSIVFNKAVISEGPSAVTLTTNDGGTGGDYSFGGDGRLTFWDTHSALTINGTRFVLVNDIATLKSDVAAEPFGSYALAKGYDASLDGTYRTDPVSGHFWGTLEGLGHAITKLKMVSPDESYSGFFGTISPAGVVRDLLFDNVVLQANSATDGAGVLAGVCQGMVEHVSATHINVTSNRRAGVGGIIGILYGKVYDSSASGVVQTKRADAGGLVGISKEMDGDHVGAIFRSHADIAVTGLTSGGLVGFNEGSIALSSASGSVARPENSYANLGGLVGWNRGSIDQSYATSIVSFDCSECKEQSRHSGSGRNHRSFVGVAGLVGLSDTEGPLITNSYSTGAVNADNAFGGGLVGISSMEIDASYAIGLVSGQTAHRLGGFSGKLVPKTDAVYWDIDTAGTSQACGKDSCPNVTGLTDAQLKSGLPAGFDPAIWAQSASINNGYPYLIANPPPQ